MRFAVSRPGVHFPSRVIPKDFKKWYLQLLCLALSKIGIVWRTSQQACLLCPWARHLRFLAGENTEFFQFFILHHFDYAEFDFAIRFDKKQPFDKKKQAFLHTVKIQYQHFAFIFIVIVFFAMFYNSNHQNCHISGAIMLKFCIQNVEHMCFILSS